MSVAFDPDLFSVIRDAAEQNGVSFAEQTRTVLRAGIEQLGLKAKR